jgi:hypothetical protein
MVGRVVRDEDDARRLVAEWTASRKLMGEWCKWKGVSRQSLQWWRLRIVGVEAAGVIRVAEVVLPTPSPEYRILLGNGREVVVGNFDAVVLGRLLAVVDA